MAHGCGAHGVLKLDARGPRGLQGIVALPGRVRDVPAAARRKDAYTPADSRPYATKDRQTGRRQTGEKSQTGCSPCVPLRADRPTNDRTTDRQRRRSQKGCKPCLPLRADRRTGERDKGEDRKPAVGHAGQRDRDRIAFRPEVLRPVLSFLVELATLLFN